MEGGSNVEGASSSDASTQQQRERAVVDAVMFQVLDNPSLREEILKHVIFGKDGVDRKVACNLRLVHKSWNESVVRILRQAHQHLFRLNGASRKAVDRFVSTFAASTEVMGSVPPLAIRDFDGLGQPENLERLSSCLSRCGDGLIQLGLRATEDGRPVKAGLEIWSLPCLHKLVITLDFNLSRSLGQGEVVVTDGDKVSTFLLKSVLRTATSLSELSLNINGPHPVLLQRPQFSVFESVILPPSLTKISTCITRLTQPLDMLARSPLPNLESLVMWVGSGSGLISDGLIIRIMENCRKSLKTVRLFGNAYSEQPGAIDVTRFPVMEQLVELHMYGLNVEPELGHDSLEEHFPKLTTLHLPTQTIGNFQKWAGSNPVPGVTSLRLYLTMTQHSKAILTMGAMQLVNFVFPNLRKLQVAMSSEDSSGLEYIFREMRQLTDLDINVRCYVEPSTTDIWDSLFTGVSVAVIARSRMDPDFWANNDLEDEVGASIKNLSELKKCSLTFARVHGVMRGSPYPSISDFLFHCALLRMPKLRELHLARRSSHNVSPEMTARWRNDGRSLTFH